LKNLPVSFSKEKVKVSVAVANTQIATASATDPDANTEFHYDFLDGAPGEFNHDKFSITSDGKLFITEILATRV
jgi:hypothetical protein